MFQLLNQIVHFLAIDQSERKKYAPIDFHQLQHKFINVPHEDVILPSIYVMMMVTVGLLHLIPPETNNRKLPETLAEANAIT